MAISANFHRISPLDKELRYLSDLETHHEDISINRNKALPSSPATVGTAAYSMVAECVWENE